MCMDISHIPYKKVFNFFNKIDNHETLFKSISIGEFQLISKTESSMKNVMRMKMMFMTTREMVINNVIHAISENEI